jgi:nitrate/nitrite-specific signal transduction histidine kinase
MDHFLKYGNSELGIDPMDNKDIMADFEELYPQVQWFEENLSSYEDATKIPLTQLEARVDLFHSMMDGIVLKLQKKSEQDIRTMMIIEIELAIFSVFIVLFEIFFIVNPIINRLLMQRQKLSEIAWHQSHVFEKHYKNIADLEYVLRVEKNPERREEIYAFIQEELDHLKRVSHTVSEAVGKATEEDITPYERAMSKITEWSRQWLFEKKVGPGILDKITRDPIREEQE